MREFKIGMTLVLVAFVAMLAYGILLGGGDFPLMDVETAADSCTACVRALR